MLENGRVKPAHFMKIYHVCITTYFTINSRKVSKYLLKHKPRIFFHKWIDLERLKHNCNFYPFCVSVCYSFFVILENKLWYFLEIHITVWLVPKQHFTDWDWEHNQPLQVPQTSTKIRSSIDCKYYFIIKLNYTIQL